jgi:O-antigen biosynthesis protein
VHYRADGACVEIINAAWGMPQSLQFNLASSHECGSLIDFIQSMQPSRIEILDPANVPFRLIDSLLALRVPYDIFIADAGLIGADNTQYMATAVRSMPSPNPDESPSKIEMTPTRKDCIDRWRDIAGRAERIIAPCPQAAAFAASVFPERTIDKLSRPAEKRGRATRKIKKLTHNYVGLVPLRCCAHEQMLMREIARRLNKLRPTMAITIIGAVIDDIGLMRSTNAFVTGAVNAEEFEREVASLGLSHLFLCATQPLFGHPILLVAESSSLPTAYFDWSAGGIKPKKKDLPIDPGASLDDITSALDRWIAAP